MPDISPRIFLLFLQLPCVYMLFYCLVFFSKALQNVDVQIASKPRDKPLLTP